MKDLSSKLLVNSALAKAPQPMSGLDILLDDPSLLESLKSNGGFASWVLKPDDPTFHGFGRIRLTGVRIFAEFGEGVKATDDKIEVRLSTSGVYIDKRPPAGETRQFVSEPWAKSFVYKWRGRDIEIDDSIAERYKDDFFNPTPFTTWTLHIGFRDGSPMDFSAATGLNVQFFGEVTDINEPPRA